MPATRRLDAAGKGYYIHLASCRDSGCLSGHGWLVLRAQGMNALRAMEWTWIFGVVMTTKWRRTGVGHGLIALMLLAMLGGCATTGGAKGAADYGNLMSQAESAVTAGRVDAALISFTDAAKADPTRKEPWVRTAQLQFDKGNYAHAIIAAEEVLQRDPDDLVADGILTVGGFRIANTSLKRLQGRGALSSETARREAEALADTLKATMGDGILAAEEPKQVEKPRRVRKRVAAPRAPEPKAPAAAAPSEPAPSSDPFKNIGGN